MADGSVHRARSRTSDQPEIIAALTRIANETGRAVRTTSHGLSIDGRSATINIELLGDDTGLLYLYCRTSSWDLPGERTDANDLISVLLGAYLRCQDENYSATLWDIDHPAVDIPTELYARYLTLDQPNRSILRADPQSLHDFKALLNNISAFERLAPLMFALGDGSQQGYSWEDAVTRDWATRVAAALGEPMDDKVQFNRRTGPDWFYYRSVRRHASVFASASVVATIEKAFGCNPGVGTMLPGITRMLYVSARARSAVGFRTEQMARRILSSLNNARLTQVTVIPLENHVLFAAGGYGLVLYRETGDRAFKTEVARIAERHQREAKLLFSPSRYEWSERIDDDRFELLVRDLLNREPGVQRVRRVGLSRDPDGRKDLIADWITPPPAGACVQDQSAPFLMRKVVVQVKASSRSINKSKVPDIRDTIEDHKCSGYFLVVSSQLTSDLTDHLDRMRTGGEFFVDWWNRVEIEDRLGAHPDLVVRYADLVRRAL